MPFDTQLEPMQARVTQLLEPARVLEWLRAQDSERQLSPYNRWSIGTPCIIGTYLKEIANLNTQWIVGGGKVEDMLCDGNATITKFLAHVIMRDWDKDFTFTLPASELADTLESLMPTEEPANG